MEPVAGLIVRIFDTGWMELGHPDRPDRLLCDESGTAMWIALSQNDWSVGDAAAHLARLWDADPWWVRDRMQEWITDLLEAGIVEP